MEYKWWNDGNININIKREIGNLIINNISNVDIDNKFNYILY